MDPIPSALDSPKLIRLIITSDFEGYLITVSIFDRLNCWNNTHKKALREDAPRRGQVDYARLNLRCAAIKVDEVQVRIVSISVHPLDSSTALDSAQRCSQHWTQNKASWTSAYTSTDLPETAE